MVVSREQWQARILNAATHISSREYQERAWFPGEIDGLLLVKRI
jgi:hypothetical protein